jgi:hypothetical protein
MTRPLLLLLFGAILLAMLAVTVRASRDRAVWKVGPPLTSDPWFQATLVDAYCGFLTFFAWVAYKEPGPGRRALWFVLLMGLGNIAVAVYMLLQLWKWDPDEGAGALLLRKS